MSLSSLLLKAGSEKGKAASVDKGLDDIFKSTTVAHSESAAASSSKEHAKSTRKEKKRKSHEDDVPTPSKRAKPDTEEQIEEKLEKSKKKEKKSKGKKESSQDVSQDLTVESSSASPSKALVSSAEVESDKSDSEDEADPSAIVHESLLKGSKSKGKAKASSHQKYVPSDETPERRNARTIFVGNVSVEVAKSRPLLKQLKRHVLSFVPTAKIESVRFRSVAFQNPTSELPSSKTNEKGKEKEGRQHDRDRASSWRQQQTSKRGDGEDEGGPNSNPDNNKVYLSTSEKKRVAYIKHEFHSSVDSVNAYIVFAHPTPVDKDRPSNLPPPKPVMDPYEAAQTAASKGDETVFLERTIRVDVVGSQDGDVKGKKGSGADVVGDPKRTIFVGSLDFASKEEDLRVFFEGLISTERGPPPQSLDEPELEESDAEEEETKTATSKKHSWVKRVRIIRDKDTLLGKGFGYIQFIDRECVDEVLSMEQSRLKFAKRKLRVQRCKTLPGSTHKVASIPTQSKGSVTSTTKKPSSHSIASRPKVSGPIPKGDPTLGTKISHLSKEERKQVKAGDADRVARRLAKKSMAKAKMSLIEKGVKGGDRERVRKRVGNEKRGAGSDKGKKSGGRVRSQKALSKLNTKK